MLHINNPDHFQDVVGFARDHGVLGLLADKLAYLSNYGNEPERPGYDGLADADKLGWALVHRNPASAVCELYKDYAAHSFQFLMKRADGANWFNGGLIYSGPGQPLDGSAPAFTVSLEPTGVEHQWSIHT